MAGVTKMFTLLRINSNLGNWFSGRNFLINVRTHYKMYDTLLREKGLPMKPKRPIGPFFRYLLIETPKLRKTNPDLKRTELLKIVGNSWPNCDPELKRQIYEEFNEESQMYFKKVSEYEESLTPEQKNEINKIQKIVSENKNKVSLKKKLEDLGKPKRPPSAFIYYMKEQPRFKGSSRHEWVNSVSESWRSMSDEEKSKWNDAVSKLMIKYKQEMREWEEKMVRMGHIDLVRNSGLIDLKSPKVE